MWKRPEPFKRLQYSTVGVRTRNFNGGGTGALYIYSSHYIHTCIVHTVERTESPNSDTERHGPGITTVTQYSNLKCLKPLIRRFKLAIWFKPNKILFQILYETIFDCY